MPHLDDAVLAALLDGESDGQAAGRPDGHRHLTECAECQERLEGMRVTRERARAILRSGTPSGAQPSFGELLRRKRRGTATPRRLASLRSLAWAASIVLALSVGWYTRELQLRPSAPSTVDLVATALESDSVSTPPPAAPERPSPRQGAPERVGVTAFDRLADARLKDAPADRERRRDAPRVVSRDTPAVANELKREEQVTGEPLAKFAAAQPAESVQEGARAAAPAPAGPPASAVTGQMRAPANPFTDDVAHATRVLGRAPLTVPGLPVTGYAVRDPDVIVRQALPGGGTIELTQRATRASEARGRNVEPAARRPAAALKTATADELDSKKTVINGIEIVAQGTVSNDSLRALLARLK